jgi:hypothetical protein
MLAKMGAVLGLKADQPKSEVLHILRELMTARRAGKGQAADNQANLAQKSD